MKSILLVTIFCLLYPWLSKAFVSRADLSPRRRPSYLQAVKLQAEPEGGEELTAIKTMEGSRMKNMGEVPDVTNDDGTAYKFWLTGKAEGALLKEIHSEILKQSAKKANFPGFKKGQVPPYAMPQIRGFAVEEGIIRTCQAAVDAYGLKTLPGSGSEVEVLEDVPEVAKDYKLGDDIQFTATFNAVFNPELVKQSTDAVIDVESEETTETATAEATE